MHISCRHEKDTAVILGKERERLEEEAAAAAAAAERLEAVLGAVARAADAGLGLGEVEDVYRGLRGQYREEYVMYNLAAAALAQVRGAKATRNRTGRGHPRPVAAPPCTRLPCMRAHNSLLASTSIRLSVQLLTARLLVTCPFSRTPTLTPAGAAADRSAAAGLVPAGRPRRPGRRLCQLAAAAGKRGGGAGLGAGGRR